MTNEIRKAVVVKAPVSKVWKALTDSKQFGQWFRVDIEGPFTVGQPSRGKMTYPGYENLPWNVEVKKIEPEKLFSFTWHPYAVDPDADYAEEPQTLVEFTLEETADGTLVTVVESGFDKLPADRRDDSIRSNTGGWEEQMKNIQKHVDG